MLACAGGLGHLSHHAEHPHLAKHFFANAHQVVHPFLRVMAKDFHHLVLCAVPKKHLTRIEWKCLSHWAVKREGVKCVWMQESTNVFCINQGWTPQAKHWAQKAEDTHLGKHSHAPCVPCFFLCWGRGPLATQKAYRTITYSLRTHFKNN